MNSLLTECTITDAFGSTLYILILTALTVPACPAFVLSAMNMPAVNVDHPLLNLYS